MKKSSSERGTLYHLKNVLHRTAVPLDPADNMKAAEDFLLVVLHSYIVAAAEAVQSNTDAVDVQSLYKEIVKRFVKITAPSPPQQSSSTTKNSTKKSPAPADTTDKIRMYAMKVVTMGLLWHNFRDSIKEGDGDCILRNWKFNLIAFKAAKWKNYSIEALNLLLQVNYLLSPREATGVQWCRCVNTSGRKGHNLRVIPCQINKKILTFFNFHEIWYKHGPH